MDPCPVPGCPRRKSHQSLMCWRHCRRVSKPTRELVYAMFRVYEREAVTAAMTGDRGTLVDTKADYMAARDDAIREASR